MGDVDLGKHYAIEAIRLEWETASGKAYKIQVSDDAKEWMTVYSTEKGAGSTEEIAGLNAAGRYVRMYGTERSTKYGYSLYEFEIFGKEDVN
jgi:hexosaminidase